MEKNLSWLGFLIFEQVLKQVGLQEALLEVTVQLICIFVFAFAESWFLVMQLIMSRIVRKPTFCICEIKDADQLRGNCEADQHLCFRYLDITIPLLL